VVNPPPLIVLIGGTDSSGGSGLGADIEVMNALGATFLPVISAITQQRNNAPVRITAVPQHGIASQLQSLFDLPISAVKIGMLPDEKAVESVCQFLSHICVKKVVLDPVLRTSSGDQLISENGWSSLIDQLIPLTGLITPNLSEAYELLGLKIKGIPHETLVRKCGSLSDKAVLLKGGHMGGDNSRDLLFQPNQSISEYNWERVKGGTSVRGTGCRLASAIAYFWAVEDNLTCAVSKAGNFVQAYIRKSTTSAPEPYGSVLQ